MLKRKRLIMDLFEWILLFFKDYLIFFFKIKEKINNMYIVYSFDGLFGLMDYNFLKEFEENYLVVKRRYRKCNYIVFLNLWKFRFELIWFFYIFVNL